MVCVFKAILKELQRKYLVSHQYIDVFKIDNGKRINR